MGKVLVTDTYLTAIANKIRSKLGTSTTYKPSQMADAIDGLYKMPTGTKSITANGTGIDVKDYASADVNVPKSFVAADEGKVVSSGELVSQTSKNIGANGTVDTTTNNQVVVAVPNSYAAGDEGKVVDNGALVSQTSTTVTQNGIVDTTLNDEVIVNVSAGGGEYIFSQDSPTSAYGGDGDTFIQYTLTGVADVIVTVTGGYNGHAVIAVSINNTQVFTATASDTYNLNYNTTHGEAVIESNTVSIDVTPPPSNTGVLTITLTSTAESKSSEFSAQGANTSYGYGNSSNSYTLAIEGSSVRQASALFIKQNGTWKGVGDIV